MIECKKVSRWYTNGEVKTEALKHVDLSISEGEFVVILGPSGSGKSTLLNVMSGLDNVSEGEIVVNDKILTDLKEKALTTFRRHHLGFIFQSYHLMPTLTVRENVEMGAYLSDNPQALKEALESVDMLSHQDKFPHQLSGGEQQRVSIARATVKNPKILFCDEPTGSLDESMGKKVLEILETLNQKKHTTIILITHNPSIAKMADRVIHMHSGQIHKVDKHDTKQNAKDIHWA